MKYFALAMLWVVMQATAPVGRKAAHGPAPGSRGTEKNSSTNNAPTAQLQPGVQPVRPQLDENNGQKLTSDHASSDVRVTSLPIVSTDPDWEMWVFSVLLVIVGAVQAWMLYRTWGQIALQGGIMQDQLMAMQGQLAAMNSSAEQTKQLIEHASNQAEAMLAAAQASANQAEAAALTAEATLKAAEVAQRTAQAVINAERPWIVIRPSSSAEGPVCTFDAHNFGRTPAEITSSHAMVAVVDDEDEINILPKDGKYPLKHRVLMVPQSEDPNKDDRTPHNVYTLYPNSVLEGQGTEGRKLIEQGLRQIMVYGIVVYEDVLTKDRHYTRFCYWWNPAGGAIPAGPDGANEHT